MPCGLDSPKHFPTYVNGFPIDFNRFQLFVKEINTLKEEKNSLFNSIQKYEHQLNGMLECNDLSCDNFYVVEHEKLALEFYNYTHKYRAFKIEINEYISGIID